MKKMVFAFLFATFGSICNAQLTQLSSLSGYLMFSGADANKYYTYMPSGNVVYVYNWNGSLYKAVSVTPPSGYSVQTVSCLSQKCINNDSKLEMCVIFVHSSATGSSSHKMWLINEDGTKINDFGDASTWASNYSSYNGETHLNVMKGTIDASYNITYTTIIYKCNGSAMAGISQPDMAELGAAYPNPSSSMITIPFKLNSKATSQIHIYDAAGHLFSTIPVGIHFNEIKLDVSDYPSGIYFYECEGISNRFVVR